VELRRAIQIIVLIEGLVRVSRNVRGKLIDVLLGGVTEFLPPLDPIIGACDGHPNPSCERELRSFRWHVNRAERQAGWFTKQEVLGRCIFSRKPFIPYGGPRGIAEDKREQRDDILIRLPAENNEQENDGMKW
jgi:hypothetical protein